MNADAIRRMYDFNEWATLDDSRVTQMSHFTLLSGKAGAAPLATLMLHVVNHSTYHRGQLATLFRHVGATPPATDLLIFGAGW